MMDVLIGAYCATGATLFLSGFYMHLVNLPADEEERAEAREVMKLSPVWPLFVYRVIKEGTKP